MTVPRVDNRAARRLFLHRHALGEQPVGEAKGRELDMLIQRLGFVQLDSVNTVARAHDMILRARRSRYRPSDLKRLYERDGTLFEHWTHDAAVIPKVFYPHWHLRFRRDAELLKARWRNWRRDGFEARFEDVLQHVRDHGPVCSSDVGGNERKGSGGWWDWHPSKTALEYLWRSGVLTVVGRDGFRKRYDLTERAIEVGLMHQPDPDHTIDWLCGAALDRLGFATPGEIAAFWDTVTPAEARDWCTRQQERGQIVHVDVQCANGALRRSLMRSETLDEIRALTAPPGRLRVLSPFDPALRDRNRAERLFGFHYRIEIFVPAAKRKFGYYVFPLLEGERMVGRIDMKAKRDSGCLVVTALWLEPGIRCSAARMRRLEAELDRVARFAGLDRFEMRPGWLRGPV